MSQATITIDRANKEFHGDIVVGQYVAYWVSDDGQDSMPMTIGSCATAEEAEAQAQAACDETGIVGGACAAELVIAEEAL